MALLKSNGRDIAWAAVDNSMFDRLHYSGDAVTTKAGAATAGPVSAADMYDVAMRTKNDGFHVDKQSAAGGVCNVDLADGRSFQDVPMKVAPPALGR
jgi:hypothetical protein